MKNIFLRYSSITGFIIALLANRAGAQTQITNFGTNPGNINAYQYVPDSMPSNAPLVLVLHGCTQTAASYGAETQWNDLADRHKFYVCYGEQTSSNNSLECFNYYNTPDITRGSGEALSLKQITDYMKANYSIDSTRVFVTGLSAGAAMTVVMCCAYPDIFNAGAEMSGLPYGCATSELEADEACFGLVSNTPAKWASLAQGAYPGYTGNYPRMAIFHGTSDETVNIENATGVIDQFTTLHNISQTPGYTNTSFNGNSIVQLEQFFDSAGNVPVEYYQISNMMHGTAVYPGTCYQQGGATDALAFNEELYSPFWAAQFFGILHLPYSMLGSIYVSSSQMGLIFSVPNTAGSTYTWTVPPGVTIVSGQGSNSVTVDWGTQSGTISVTEMPADSCELGPVGLFVTIETNLGGDPAVSQITGASGTVCASSIMPSFTLTNSGSDTLTSDSIYYAIDNTLAGNYLWTGLLAPSQTTTVSLPSMAVSTGSHLLTIFSSSPNGGPDLNPANDTATTGFTAGVTPMVNLGSDTTQCGGSVELDAGNAGDSYSWSTNSTTETISVSQTDNYSVTVTSNGCSASADINVTIKAPPCSPTGVAEIADDNKMVLFPNPNSTGSLHVELSREIAGLRLKIYNVIGATVVEKNLTGSKNLVDISSLAPGVYMVAIDGSGIALRKKLVLQ